MISDSGEPFQAGGPSDESKDTGVGDAGRNIGWAAALFLFVLAAFIFGHRLQIARGAGQASRSGYAAVGSSAPDFRFVGVDARFTQIGSLSATRGRPVWVNFFATWCPPCKAEMPEIERRSLAHQNDGFLVVGADQQETADLVHKFARDYGLTFPLVIDSGDGTLAYGVSAIPTSVFIDASGTVRGIYRGQMSAAQMDAAVQMIHNDRP